MKNLLGVLLVVSLFGCTKTNSTLTPIQQVGCEIESAVSTSFSAGVASAMSCTNQAAIQASLQTAFGNANLCAGPASAVTAAQIKTAKSLAVKPQGVVGNLACPIAVSSALGFLTNSVPSSWGCSASASASTLQSTLVSLCETAIPL